ncbi:Peptide chain release factor 2 [Caldithrix abyssi DSM 13497]|uniref:Peptide chain release factor 2 n=1 Tax=Caldithrix abyssi DSM 13497 TaxID=880073 RepID=H1XP10_CALAY|nr:peptide chain release factor 2 [Caldithrix abyssi]EHO41002.1 Peptide chain release factor 2 [Caldithrix abyssi DSM 13497]
MEREYLQRLEELEQRVKELRGYLDIDNRTEQIKRLEEKTGEDGFWNDQEKAQKVLKQINRHKEWVDAWQSVNNLLEEAKILIEMLAEDESEALKDELVSHFKKMEKEINALEFKRMLSGRDDPKNAILTIHPGAGGTESQDWASMLMRMYLRFAERQGFETEIMDYQPGEEAGIKSVTIEVKGNYAYGYLKAENGVHRLVRISPFDANKRRHTSFASVFVIPEIDENIDVEINPSDLRIDTYRASGAGGQHVNKTDSAIRITHLPTGIVVQCQNERSQHKNKANALKILAARLYQLKLEEQLAKKKEYEESKRDIAWGSQIRSYVFHPYNMVKDHRTNYETSNVQQVMDGDIYPFIEKYLVQFGGQG